MNIPRKVYIKVIAEFDTVGAITPLKLEWEDGQRYDVDRMFNVVSSLLEE